MSGGINDMVGTSNWMTGTSMGSSITTPDAVADYTAFVSGATSSTTYDADVPASDQEIVARSSIAGSRLSDISINTFLSWDTPTQIAFLKQPSTVSSSNSLVMDTLQSQWGGVNYNAQGTGGVGAAPGRSFGFGAADGITDPQNQMWVMLSNDNTKVYVLNNLQKSDIAQMSQADQQTLTQSPYWSTLSAKLGLYSASDSQETSVTTQIAAVQAEINNAQTAASDSANGMTAADKQVFLDEISDLNSQLAKMAIFSPTDIQNQLNAIKTRFERVQAFSLQKAPVINFTQGIPVGIVSTDGNATILSGYQNFMAQEKQILNVTNAAASLTASSTFNGKNLDVPTLIYYFQMYANLAQQAAIAADTEEVNQLNALLNTYSQMQTDVNTTMQAFGTSDTQTLGFMAPQTNPTQRASLSTDQLYLGTIFEDWDAGYKHPLEAMYGIQKPTMDMYFDTNAANANLSLNTFTKAQWTDFSNSLANTVTQINQQTQIKMNNLDSAIKQKDREFDLGNNALSKLSDMIQSISRGLA